MARFYSNENFPLPVVEGLRALGHDILTIQETGKANQSVDDEDVLAFAHSQNRILVTRNRKHFIRLHKQKIPHSGIVACSYDPNFPALAKRNHQAVMDEKMGGKLTRVNRL